MKMSPCRSSLVALEVQQVIRQERFPRQGLDVSSGQNLYLDSSASQGHRLYMEF